MNTSTTKLPIGEEFFDDMILGGNYYVDKTLFIKDILDNGAKFTLCTRPRRFGKTLNQTMLKCFFEDTTPLGGEDTRALFKGLKIEAAGDKYMSHQGKYPVIFLSFKDVKEKKFEDSCDVLKDLIAEEFCRHEYVQNSNSLSAKDGEFFEELKSGKANDLKYKRSIKFLCKCLETYYHKKTIILIDEYDVPLENSWSQGFYDDMVGFIRSLMSNALKGNRHLQFAVLTGCLRISKESIFTGLNNLDVISILSDRYDEYFGFTQNELDAMLTHYNIKDKTQLIKNWYNGYLFGKATVYNPWSVIKSVTNWAHNPDRLPEPHWANTSSNDIVRQLIDTADGSVKDDLETLMSGGVISKRIQEDIVYNEIHKHSNNIWNMLFFTGYLKKVGERLEGVQTILDLSIPNLEIQYIYETMIQEWLNEKITEKNFDQFFDALLNSNDEIVQDELNNILFDSISYMDGKEDFYHGLVIGVLNRLQKYAVKSNRETGLGRCDIVLKHLIRRDKAVLMELKWTNDDKTLKEECDAALKQIEDNEYAHELQSEGYTDIIKYGIAFCGKYCEVKVGRREN